MNAHYLRRGSRRYANSESPIAAVDPRVSDWVSRVVRNGGATPTQQFQLALGGFYQDVSTAGLFAKMVSVCIPVPGNIVATTTPVIVGGASSDPYANLGAFVDSDVTLTGLQGNGAKFFNTGIIPSRTSMTSISAGLVMYVSIDHNTVSIQQEMGCSGSATNSQFSLFNNADTSGTNNGLLLWRFDTPGTNQLSGWSARGAGFYSGQRIAANAIAVYYAKSSTAFSAIATGSGTQTGSIEAAQPISFMALNNNGPVANVTRKCLSFMAATTGLTSTDSQNLYNAVQRMLIAKGGGFV